MEEKENIKIAFFLNLGFSLFEIIGGLLTNSVAIFSDALHDFADSFAIAISYFLENISTKKSDKKYTYGYKRFSILGAVINSFILIIGALIVIFNSLLRIFNPVKLNLTSMFIFSIFGIAINGYATYKTSKNIDLNEKTVNLHMLEDVLGWIAVLFGTFLIKITNWNQLDTVLAMGIALFIGYKAIKNLLDAIDVMLEKTPAFIDIDLLTSELKNIKFVLDVHHVHTWSIDGEKILITMHVLVDKNLTKKNFENLKNEIKVYLKKKGIEHSTIEIEYEKCKELDCQ